MQEKKEGGGIKDKEVCSMSPGAFPHLRVQRDKVCGEGKGVRHIGIWGKRGRVSWK